MPSFPEDRESGPEARLRRRYATTLVGAASARTYEHAGKEHESSRFSKRKSLYPNLDPSMY